MPQFKNFMAGQIELITPAIEQRIIEKAFLSRKVEERLLDLYEEGKLFGTVHTCIGQEFSGAVVTEFLKTEDSVFSNHRCHGHFLSFTNDVEGLIAEVMGKSTGVCAGRGGSQHLCKDGFYSNGLQGGIVPVTAGLALARKIRNDKSVSVVFIGDGTLGEGAIYEIFNIASKWELPMLIVLENNGYAQSTNQQETLAGSISARAEAFGIRSAKSETWNWKSLYPVAQDLVEFVRGEVKPAFLEIDTYRLKAHSKGDDTRSRSEVEPFEKADPLNILFEKNSAQTIQMLHKIHDEIHIAVATAEAAPDAVLGLIDDTAGVEPLKWKESFVTRKRVGKALNEVMMNLMGNYPKMVFLGEDICSPYGGAFKVSMGLSDEFPERVWNTPISESAIIGIGLGLAMEGFLPFVEIMFGDFMTLTMDQILNHASKFHYMYNGQVKTNMVIRTPMGGGRGYGPTHSQTLDRHFMGIPGLRILALNNLIDPALLYDNLIINSETVTLVIENKQQYSQFLREKLPQGFKTYISNETYPTAVVRPETQKVDVTLVGYGGTSEMLVLAADRLFEEHDIVAQILCPMQIYPMKISPYLALISEASLLVLVEEGQGFAGFSSEIIAQISEEAPELLTKVRRVVPIEMPIPAAGKLEKVVLPSIDSIIESVLELAHEV